MRSLKGILTNIYGLDLTGWTLTGASGISDDGKTIVGRGINPDGNEEAWIAGLHFTVATIDDILVFFDESVEEGTIVGCGKKPWIANLKLWLFGKTIEAAKYFIEKDKMRQACKALNRTFLRCDGELGPKDFVEGEAVLELADMISDLMDELGCE
jgi:hypothetical protein